LKTRILTWLLLLKSAGQKPLVTNSAINRQLSIFADGMPQLDLKINLAKVPTTEFGEVQHNAFLPNT
jgi:hypothetical protein